MNGNYSIVASRVGSAYGLKGWVGRDLCAYHPYGSVTAMQVCEGLQEGFTRSVFNKGLQEMFTRRVCKKGLQEGCILQGW